MTSPLISLRRITGRTSPPYHTRTTCELQLRSTAAGFSQSSSRAQYAVLTKELNVKKVYCVIGFSMGGQQVPILAVLFPPVKG